MRMLPAVAVGAAAAYVGRGRRRQLHWGATPEETTAPLPGDDLLDRADLVATRAIGIARPPAEVWPWIAQLGQGRGGFYSYQQVENLLGCRITNADGIVLEWQHPAVGDAFHLHPQVALRVAVVEPGVALVVAGIADPEPTADAPPYDFTWAFVLRGDGAAGIRLVVRERMRYRSRWAPLIVEPLAVASFAMTERMLRGIRDRAEAASRP